MSESKRRLLWKKLARLSFLFSVFLALSPAYSFAVVQDRPPIPGGEQNYGPWNRDLEIFESGDGSTFLQEGIVIERGGVPNLARARDGTLFLVFQWFPLDWPEAFDRIAISRSQDDGRTWTEPRPITIQETPESLYRAFDPALAILDDGSLRIYFASERVTPEKARGNRAIFSARSQDGVNFIFEPGQRFGFVDRETFDPAVAYFDGKWHLYCPVQGEPGAAYYTSSEDGLNFADFATVTLPPQHIWIGNAIVISKKLWFYGSGPHGVWRAHSSNGKSWKLDPSFRLSGGDPAVAVKRDQSLLVITTGPLRPDAFPGHPQDAHILM